MITAKPLRGLKALAYLSSSRLTHWQRHWCWERLRARGEGDDRGWDSWIASPTWWTWVWANSGREWRTRKPGVLQSMGSQRVRHDLATKQQLRKCMFLSLPKKSHRERIILLRKLNVKILIRWETEEADMTVKECGPLLLQGIWKQKSLFFAPHPSPGLEV